MLLPPSMCKKMSVGTCLAVRKEGAIQSDYSAYKIVRTFPMDGEAHYRPWPRLAVKMKFRLLSLSSSLMSLQCFTLKEVLEEVQAGCKKWLCNFIIFNDIKTLVTLTFLSAAKHIRVDP